MWPSEAEGVSARRVAVADDTVVRLEAQVRHTTVLAVPADERILEFVLGDPERWGLAGTANIALLKPMAAGARTSVTLVTDAGQIYAFTAEEGSGDPDLMVYVRRAVPRPGRAELPTAATVPAPVQVVVATFPPVPVLVPTAVPGRGPLPVPSAVPAAAPDPVPEPVAVPLTIPVAVTARMALPLSLQFPRRLPPPSPLPCRRLAARSRPGRVRRPGRVWRWGHAALVALEPGAVLAGIVLEVSAEGRGTPGQQNDLSRAVCGRHSRGDDERWGDA